MTKDQTHGQVSWNDESLDAEARKGKGKEQFLRLKPGSNLIRVLTLPFQYYQHKYKIDGEKGYGHKIYCSIKHGFCPVCAKGDKPKKRWYLGVIDRSTQSYKILDVNWSILNDIQTYAKDDDWGDTTQYDFDIVVNPNGGPMAYYKAVAKPKRPLSAQDLMIQEKIDISDLERRCMPPEPKKVEERLQGLMEDFLKSSGGVESSGRNNQTVSFEDDSSDFPNADAPRKSSPFG